MRLCCRLITDRGNAVVEFLLLPLLLLPIVFGSVQIFARLRLEAALDDAVRSAGRAYSISAASPTEAAVVAAKFALSDRSVIGSARVSGSPAIVTVTGSLRPLGWTTLRGTRTRELP